MIFALSAFHIATLVGAVALLAAAAINDAHHYKIPNLICASLIALFPVFVLTAPSPVDWPQHALVGALVLISGFGMFLGNLAGAGDIKLLAATSLWAGPHLIAVFLVTTAVAGGFLAVGVAIMTHIRNRSGRQATALAKVPIPYGIAIAVGGLNVIYMTAQPIIFPG